MPLDSQRLLKAERSGVLTESDAGMPPAHELTGLLKMCSCTNTVYAGHINLVNALARFAPGKLLLRACGSMSQACVNASGPQRLLAPERSGTLTGDNAGTLPAHMQTI